MEGSTSGDIYLELRDFLDQLPGGFPSTPSGVELRILRKLFSPEEAEVLLHLKPFPEPPATIAERMGRELAETEAMLERMASKGLIYRHRRGDDAYYMAIQFVVGIYEFQVGNLDRELAEMMEEYLPYIRRVWEGLKTSQFRVVPVQEAVDDTQKVATYDRIRELLAEQDLIAVAPCICRREMKILGKGCDKPEEACFVFGASARYYLENGIARQVSLDEALRILDLAEEHALVLFPNNAVQLLNMCCCCGCCCGVLRSLKAMERPAEKVLTRYRVVVDAGACVACGTCLERCQMEALVEEGNGVKVLVERCIGCGLCVPTCPQGALRLEMKEEAGEPPANVVETFTRIAVERGVNPFR
ncbi:MAG: 4Fe-4S binding protein [Candidatus Geothermincolales bacterium]